MIISYNKQNFFLLYFSNLILFLILIEMSHKSIRKTFYKNSKYEVKKKNNNINCIGEMDHNLIEYCWSISFNYVFKYKPKVNLIISKSNNNK
jgi:hypothetical protein